MCQAVSPHPCSALLFFICVSVGLCEGGPCLHQCTRGLPLLFILLLRRLAWHHELLLGRKRGEQIIEGGRFWGACVVANLHHMEEMSFLCKTCFFLMCLSCTDDDESQQMNPPPSPFLSLPLPFCPPRAEKQRTDTRGGNRLSSSQLFHFF